MDNLIQLYPGDFALDGGMERTLRDEYWGGALMTIHAAPLEELNLIFNSDTPTYSDYLWELARFFDGCDPFLYMHGPLGNAHSGTISNCVFKARDGKVTTYSVPFEEHVSLITGEPCRCFSHRHGPEALRIEPDRVIITCHSAIHRPINRPAPLKMTLTFERTDEVNAILELLIPFIEEYQKVLEHRKKIANLIEGLNLQPTDLRTVPAGSILLARRRREFFGPLRLGNTWTRVWDRSLDYVGLLGVSKQDDILQSRSCIMYQGRPTNGYTWGDSIADVYNMTAEFFLLIPGKGKPWREYADPTQGARGETLHWTDDIDSEANYHLIEDYLNGFNIDRVEKLLGIS